MMSVVIRCNTG